MKIQLILMVFTKLVKAFALAPVFENLSNALPSSSSKSLCSKKCAIPSGTETGSVSLTGIKRLSIEPYLVAKTAYDF